MNTRKDSSLLKKELELNSKIVSLFNQDYHSGPEDVGALVMQQLYNIYSPFRPSFKMVVSEEPLSQIEHILLDEGEDGLEYSAIHAKPADLAKIVGILLPRRIPDQLASLLFLQHKTDQITRSLDYLSVYTPFWLAAHQEASELNTDLSYNGGSLTKFTTTQHVGN